MVKLTKASVEKMAAEMPSTNESNPQAAPQSASAYGYTLDQFLEMYDRGTWTGGYITTFGKEYGVFVIVQYYEDTYYLDGYDSEGNPLPSGSGSGGEGEDMDDSGLIKGDAGNPYTLNEYFLMLENQTWTGGFVVGLGYVAGTAIVQPNELTPEVRAEIVNLALSYEGIDEVQDAKQVEEWLKQAGVKNPNSTTTGWCAAFVNSVLSSQGIGGPGNPANSQAWRYWGEPTNNPQPGDVAVWRVGRHVGIVCDIIDSNTVSVVSGNYGNAVKVDTLGKDTFNFRTYK